MVAALSGQRGCGHCPHLNRLYCARLRPLELPSSGLHLLMHVGGLSDMTRIRKRSACAGSFQGESSAATIDRVPLNGPLAVSSKRSAKSSGTRAPSHPNVFRPRCRLSSASYAGWLRKSRSLWRSARSGLCASVPRRPRHGGTQRGKAWAYEHPCCKGLNPHKSGVKQTRGSPIGDSLTCELDGVEVSFALERVNGTFMVFSGCEDSLSKALTIQCVSESAVY